MDEYNNISTSPCILVGVQDTKDDLNWTLMAEPAQSDCLIRQEHSGHHAQFYTVTLSERIIAHTTNDLL